MNHLFRSAAFTLLLLAAGCSSSSHQLVPMPAQDVTVTRGDLTRIYLVRDGWVGIGERGIEVFDDQTKIGDVDPGTFLCWERPAGRTVGRVIYYSGPVRGSSEGMGDLNCAAGQAYYFKVTVDREGGKPQVQAVDPAEGRQLVAARKPASSG